LTSIRFAAGALSLCALLAATPRLAAAQAAPAASPSPAISPSPAPSPSPPPKLLQFSGSLDAGYTGASGTNKLRFTNGVPSTVFGGAVGPYFDANGGRLIMPANDFVNSPTLQDANVQLTVNGKTIGGKLEGIFGTDADFVASNGQPRSGANLAQAYISYTGGPLTAIVGKFWTLAGVEVAEAPGNTNYSRSFLFGYAIMSSFTGVRATYVVNPKVTVIAGANNGWDDWKFAGKKKTIEGSLALTPSPGYSVNLTTYNGNDFAVFGNTALGLPPVYTNRMLYDGILTMHPTSALTLIANYDNGTQLGDAFGAFPTSHWNGIAGYVNYQFNPKYGVSVRKETFRDAQGFRTGLAQRLQSNTVTLNYTPTAAMIYRAEYRRDTSDGNNFLSNNIDPLTTLPLGRNHQNTFGAEAVLKF
jgi:hypothetical protein